MYQGQIIDTHMHLWDIKNGYSWLPVLAEGKFHHNFFMQDYLEMCKNQPISQMVHIECGGFPQNPVLETRWVQQQADRYGGPQAIIAYARLDAPGVEEILKGHSQFPNLRGIRMPLNYVAGCFGADRDDYMTDAAWRKGYALLSKYNLHFEMQIYDSQIPDACKIAREFPDIPIVLEHLGWPLKSDLDYLPEWKDRLSQLAQYPNVFLKISCVGWVFKKIDPSVTLSYIKTGLLLFGTHRCIVGSNCPPDEFYISFDEIFHVFKSALDAFSDLEQQSVFYGNAKNLYRL